MSSLQLLAEQIALHKPGIVFGIPGSGASLELLDELEKRGVDFLLTHFEGAAAMMAGTIGHLSGKAGVAISIKGPGLTNMLPGLALCRFEKFPLVAISEAYHPAAPASKAHKRIEHHSLTSAITKGGRYLAAAGPGFPELAGWAAAEIPAPVLLELPDKPLDEEKPLPPSRQWAGDDPRAIINLAERPVIVAGSLALRLQLSSALNKLQLPVFTTAAARGAVDEYLPHAGGIYTGVAGPGLPEKVLLPEADLIIGIGLHAEEVLAAGPFPCQAVNIDCLPREESKTIFNYLATAHCGMLGQIFELLADKKWGLDQLGESLAALRHRLLAGPFLPAHVYQMLNQVFGKKARLVVDTGNFCTIAEHFWRTAAPGAYLSSGQGRYMGSSLPMGIAAALYDSTIPTIVAVGDGGIGPFLAEVKVAVEKKLPLITILMSDGCFGSIRTRAIRDNLSQQPLTISSPSWLTTMESFGMPVLCARNQDHLFSGLSAWKQAEGPIFIEVPFKPDAYEAAVKGIR